VDKNQLTCLLACLPVRPLTGISLMDAGSMAVFSFACLLLYKMAGRFAEAVDKATMEVADYTVVVKGLPETTPIDVSGDRGWRD
jgi:hypothetical protein